MYATAEDGGDVTSWRHFDPDFDYSLYEVPPTGQEIAFQPRDEALSYTWVTRDNAEIIHIAGSLKAVL
jgi:hypothetical protein